MVLWKGRRFGDDVRRCGLGFGREIIFVAALDVRLLSSLLYRAGSGARPSTHTQHKKSFGGGPGEIGATWAGEPGCWVFVGHSGLSFDSCGLFVLSNHSFTLPRTSTSTAAIF